MTGERDTFDSLKRQVGLLKTELAKLNQDLLRLRVAESSREVLIEDLRRALAESDEPEIVTMCAHCKGIKGEHGQWEKPEALLTSRFGLAVSHGVCPECRHTHYPYLPPVAAGKASC